MTDYSRIHRILPEVPVRPACQQEALQIFDEGVRHHRLFFGNHHRLAVKLYGPFGADNPAVHAFCTADGLLLQHHRPAVSGLENRPDTYAGALKAPDAFIRINFYHEQSPAILLEVFHCGFEHLHVEFTNHILIQAVSDTLGVTHLTEYPAIR